MGRAKVSPGILETATLALATLSKIGSFTSQEGPQRRDICFFLPRLDAIQKQLLEEGAKVHTSCSVLGFRLTTDRWSRPGSQWAQVIWQGQCGVRWKQKCCFSFHIL